MVDSQTQHPSFLAVPARPAKPRSSGVTHVLDGGLDLLSTRAALDAVAPLVDIWKFGWGTAYLDRQLADKLDALRGASVLSCTGGTLLEIAWVQERTAGFFDWVVEVGMDCVEVSNGATGLPVTAKRELMATALDRGLTVLSEVGSKDPDAEVDADEWVEEIVGDLAAGATWVVAEGRESGTVGMYDADGEVRHDVVDAIDAEVAADRIIYEAPRRRQQAALLRRFGPSVNLGNITTSDVASVESLRAGLRTDTMGISTTIGSALA